MVWATVKKGHGFERMDFHGARHSTLSRVFWDLKTPINRKLSCENEVRREKLAVLKK